MLVEVEHQVVGHDRVAGGEERDQPRDQVPLGVGEPLQVLEVGVQVDLLDGPGVLDGVAVAVVEVRVAHRPQGQVHARVEQHPVGVGGRVGSVVTGRPRSSRGSPASRRAASLVAWYGRRTAGHDDRVARPMRGGLLDPRRRARAQVVGGLEPGLPGVQVHRGELADRRPRDEQVERLALVDERPSARRPCRSAPAAAAPRRCGRARRTSSGSAVDALHRALGPLDRLADLGGPQAAGLELADQRGVDLQELARQRLALEQVGDLRLDALVAAGDRGDRRRRGDRDRAASCAARARRPPRAAPPSARSGCTATSQRSGCSTPCAARVSAYAGCGAVRGGPGRRRPRARSGRSPPRSGSTARGPRGSRTAGRARRTRPAGPSAPGRPGASAGWTRAASSLG